MNGCTHAHAHSSIHMVLHGFRISQIANITKFPTLLIFNCQSFLRNFHELLLKFHVFTNIQRVLQTFCGQFYILFLNPARQASLFRMKNVWPALAEMIKSSMCKNRHIQITLSSFCELRWKELLNSLVFFSQEKKGPKKKSPSNSAGEHGVDLLCF